MDLNQDELLLLSNLLDEKLTHILETENDGELMDDISNILTKVTFEYMLKSSDK